NSALPRMVQPVSSEARFNLMSGVLPIASTTSLLMVMSGKSLPVPCQIVRDPSAHAAKVNGFCSAAKLSSNPRHRARRCKEVFSARCCCFGTFLPAGTFGDDDTAGTLLTAFWHQPDVCAADRQ